MNKKSSSNQVTLLIILLIILAAVLVVPAMIGFYAQKQFNNFVQQFNQKNQTLHVEIDQYNLGWYKSQAKITISRTNGDQDLVKQYPVSIIHGPLFSYSGQFMLGFAKAQFDAIPDPNNPTQDSIYFGFDHHVYGLIHLNMPLHYSKFVSFDKGKLSFQTNPSITKFKTQTTLHNIKTGNGLPAVKTKIKHFDLHVRGQKRDKEGGDWQYATDLKINDMSHQQHVQGMGKVQTDIDKLMLEHLRIAPDKWLKEYQMMLKNAQKQSATPHQHEVNLAKNIISTMITPKTKLVVLNSSVTTKNSKVKLDMNLTWPGLAKDHAFQDVQQHTKAKTKLHIPYLNIKTDEAHIKIDQGLLKAKQNQLANMRSQITIDKLVFQQPSEQNENGDQNQGDKDHKEQTSFNLEGLTYNTHTTGGHKSADTSYQWDIDKLCIDHCYHDLEGELNLDHYNLDVQNLVTESFLALSVLAVDPGYNETHNFQQIWAQMESKMPEAFSKDTKLNFDMNGKLEQGDFKLSGKIHWPGLPDKAELQTFIDKMTYEIHADYPKPLVQEWLDTLLPKQMDDSQQHKPSAKLNVWQQVARAIHKQIHQGQLQPQDGQLKLKVKGQGYQLTLNGQQISLQKGPDQQEQTSKEKSEKANAQNDQEKTADHNQTSDKKANSS